MIDFLVSSWWMFLISWFVCLILGVIGYGLSIGLLTTNPISAICTAITSIILFITAKVCMFAGVIGIICLIIREN